MSNEQLLDLYEPKRQSPVAIMMFIISFIRKFFNIAIYVFIPLFVGKQAASIMTYLEIAALVIAVFILTMSILSYFKYYYFIDDQSFNIQKGVLSKKKVNLPFERIQNINFEQKIIHQIFGVVTLQIDTAGSAGNEIKVEALPKAEAEAIRDYILEQKRELSLQHTDTDEEVAGVEEAEVIERKPDELLLNLGILDLMKIGVSQNHIRTAFIIIGLGFSFAGNLEDIFKINFFDLFVENADFIGNTYIFPLVFFLIISFFITLVRTILKHFDLRFYKSHEGFKVTSGLFTRQEVALRREKVQIIQWTDNPIRRIFKIFTLDIKQAVSGIVRNNKQKAEVPGCYQHQVDEVLKSCFPDLADEDFSEHRIHSAFVIRRFIYFGLIPLALFLTLYFILEKINFLVIAIAFPVFALLLLLLFHKKYRVYVGTQFIKIKKGFFGTSRAVFPLYKIQAVEIEQSIYQRRKDLANVSIHTANGTLTIPYFPLEKALELKNYALYKVESENRPWM